MGLDPRTPGSCPEPKADAQPLSHPGAPHLLQYLNAFLFFLSFFFKIFIYLFIHERHTERERHRQREKQAPCREPNVGLDPRSPGSGPGLKAALNR